jgi:hypothetical protein
MRKPLSIRLLTEDEQHTLQEGWRSSPAWVLRRGHIRLARARGQTARVIGATLGCDDQTVRQALPPFHPQGLAARTRHASAPQRTPQAACAAPRREPVRALLHQSPRPCGHAPSLWPWAWAAEVAYAEGLTPRPSSGEARRRALARLGVRWQRAPHGRTSPAPASRRKPPGAPGAWLWL